MNPVPEKQLPDIQSIYDTTTDKEKNDASRIWFQYILDHPDRQWSYAEMSQNPNMTFNVMKEVMLEHPEIDFCLTDNESIVLNHRTGKMILGDFIQNENFTWEFIEENSHIPWNYDLIIDNENITLDIIQNNPDKFQIKDDICGNPNITVEYLEKNPDFKWSPLYGTSWYGNIPFEYVKKNMGKPWNFEWLSRLLIITQKIILDNPDFPWNYSSMSGNHSISYNFIKEHPEKEWNYYTLCRWNKNILWDIVKENPDIQWDYDALCANTNITWDIIETNPDLLNNYQFISENPNITWDIVEANLDKPWDYYRLSGNQMTKNPFYIGNQTNYVLK